MGRDRANTIGHVKGNEEESNQKLSAVVQLYERSNTQPAIGNHAVHKHSVDHIQESRKSSNLISDDVDIYVICHAGKKPIDFISKRLIFNGGVWRKVVQFLSSSIYYMIVLLIGIFTFSYVKIRDMFDISSPAMALLPLLPFFIVFLLELSQIDRRVLGSLLFFTHSYYYLLFQILVFSGSSMYHYQYSAQHINSDEDDTILYRSVPFFVLFCVFLITYDALVYRHLIFKRIILFLGILYIISILIEDTFGWDKHRNKTNEFDFCTLFCITVLRLRYGTLIILLIYLSRMFYEAIIKPENAVLLRVPVKFQIQIDMKTDISSEASLDRLRQIHSSRAVDTIEQGKRYLLCHSRECSDLKFRTSYKDCVLYIPILAYIGRTKAYAVFLSLYIVFAWTMIVSTISVEPYVAMLMNIPVIFVVFVELSSRMNKNILKLTIQRFEWQYLMALIVLWVSQLVMRNSLQTQDYDTSITLYFSPFHIFIGLTGIISFDGYVSPKAIKIKKISLIILFILIPVWLLYSRFGGGAENYFWCHLWCSDTYELENTAQLNLWLFICKYVYRIVREPDRFLILNDHLNIQPYLRERNVSTATISIHHAISSSSPASILK